GAEGAGAFLAGLTGLAAGFAAGFAMPAWGFFAAALGAAAFAFLDRAGSDAAYSSERPIHSSSVAVRLRISAWGTTTYSRIRRPGKGEKISDFSSARKRSRSASPRRITRLSRWRPMNML